jgi:hypothetical protein
MRCGLSARTFVHHAFYSSTGKSPPPRAIRKINPLRGRTPKSKTSVRPQGQFCLPKGACRSGGRAMRGRKRPGGHSHAPNPTSWAAWMKFHRAWRSPEARGPESLASKQLGNSKSCQLPLSGKRTPGKSAWRSHVKGTRCPPSWPCRILRDHPASSPTRVLDLGFTFSQGPDGPQSSRITCTPGMLRIRAVESQVRLGAGRGRKGQERG